jgi:DNA-binding CsgD family transcriptional regulator
MRGYKLNQALAEYLATGPQEGPRSAPSALRRPHRVRQRLNGEAIGQLVDAYQAGVTAKELGERYGIAKSTVLVLLRQAGISVRHPRFTPGEVIRAVELYRARESQTEIAQLLGLNPSAVWHILRRAGVI